MKKHRSAVTWASARVKFDPGQIQGRQWSYTPLGVGSQPVTGLSQGDVKSRLRDEELSHTEVTGILADAKVRAKQAFATQIASSQSVETELQRDRPARRTGWPAKVTQGVDPTTGVVVYQYQSLNKAMKEQGSGRIGQIVNKGTLFRGLLWRYAAALSESPPSEVPQQAPPEAPPEAPPQASPYHVEIAASWVW